MTEPSSTPPNPDQIKIVKMAIYAMAGLLIIIGTLCFVKPKIIQPVLNIDELTLQIFGGVLFVMAAFDIFFLAPLLNKRDPK